MVLVLGLAVPGSRAETGQTVTIPRARYEELLRKEQELERLRSTHAQTPPGQPGSFGPTGPPAPNSGAGLSGTAVLASGPALDSLPPLPDQGPIRASLLAAYFLREPATAATRLRDQTLRVTGRVVGFEKPLLTRNYHVLLETDQPTVRVRCVVNPWKISAASTSRRPAPSSCSLTSLAIAAPCYALATQPCWRGGSKASRARSWK